MVDESNEKEELSSKMLITFPKSKEDHRLQLVGINDAVFAIVHSPLESQGPIHLHCEDWSLVLLAPLKSKSDIEISAVNVICLSEIVSDEGLVNIHASNKLVKFAPISKSDKKLTVKAVNGEFQFDDDPATLLYCYRLFQGIVADVRSESPEMISKAQQRFITALCMLSDKIKGNSASLDLKDVLEIWNIPPKFTEK
jgi:hypothetical protein